MSLAINSEKGKEYAAAQARAIDAILKSDKEGTLTFDKFETEGEQASSVIEGFFVRKGIIKSCVEVKSRELSLETLQSKSWNFEWLMTNDKICWMATICGLCRVPGYGILYLMHSNLVLMKQLVTREGFLCENYRVENTGTKASCLGGYVYRDNAFINMEQATRFQVL